NVFVIDEKRWRVTSRYLSVFEPHFKTSGTHQALWIKAESGVCVSAPTSKPMLLETSNDGCQSDTKLIAASGFFNSPRFDHLIRLLPELSYLKDYLVAEDGHFVERDSGYATADRLRETRYLVIRTGCNDCNE